MYRRDIIKSLPIGFLAASLLETRAVKAIGAPLQKITISVTREDPAFLALKFIKIKKLDVKKGIDLKINTFATLTECREALTSGLVKIASADLLLYSNSNVNLEKFLVIPHFTYVPVLTAPASRKLNNITDLFGKKIGVAIDKNSFAWMAIRVHYFKIVGKHIEDDVNLVFGSPEQIFSLLEENKLHFVLQNWGYNAKAIGREYKQFFLFDQFQHNEFVNFKSPAFGWYISKKDIQNNYADIKAVLDIFETALRGLKSDRVIWLNLASEILVSPTSYIHDLYRMGVVDTYEKSTANEFIDNAQLLDDVWSRANKDTKVLSKIDFFKP